MNIQFTTDIDGGTRPETGAWDVGADEYGVGLGKKAIGQEPKKVVLPKVFALYQNMPNPFNPVTKIRYDIPYRKGRSNQYQARLDIYNIRGQLVRTLVNGIRNPGYHSVIWGGRDMRGKALSSGMYVYMFRAGKFVKKRKRILIK